MILAAALLALAADEPRFTRTESPDARVRAEVYARDTRDPAEQAHALLGRIPHDTRQVETPDGPIWVLTAEQPGAPNQRLAAYAAQGGREDWMCLLSTQDPAGRDNRQEAMLWCMTFILSPGPVVLDQPAAPEG